MSLAFLSATVNVRSVIKNYEEKGRTDDMSDKKDLGRVRRCVVGATAYKRAASNECALEYLDVT